MAASKVKDRKERLRWVRPRAPVGFPRGHVPGFFRCLELIVLLGAIGAIVTSLTQQNGKGLDLFGQGRCTTHVLGAQCGLIHAGDDATATGRADSCGRKGMGVPCSLGG